MTTVKQLKEYLAYWKDDAEVVAMFHTPTQIALSGVMPQAKEVLAGRASDERFTICIVAKIS
jgi:hypothetical protein